MIYTILCRRKLTYKSFTLLMPPVQTNSFQPGLYLPRGEGVENHKPVIYQGRLSFHFPQCRPSIIYLSRLNNSFELHRRFCKGFFRDARKSYFSTPPRQIVRWLSFATRVLHFINASRVFIYISLQFNGYLPVSFIINVHAHVTFNRS